MGKYYTNLIYNIKLIYTQLISGNKLLLETVQTNFSIFFFTFSSKALALVRLTVWLMIMVSFYNIFNQSIFFT